MLCSRPVRRSCIGLLLRSIRREKLWLCVRDEEITVDQVSESKGIAFRRRADRPV